MTLEKTAPHLTRYQAFNQGRVWIASTTGTGLATRSQDPCLPSRLPWSLGGSPEGPLENGTVRRLDKTATTSLATTGPLKPRPHRLRNLDANRQAPADFDPCNGAARPDTSESRLKRPSAPRRGHLLGPLAHWNGWRLAITRSSAISQRAPLDATSQDWVPLSHAQPVATETSSPACARTLVVRVWRLLTTGTALATCDQDSRFFFGLLSNIGPFRLGLSVETKHVRPATLRRNVACRMSVQARHCLSKHFLAGPLAFPTVQPSANSERRALWIRSSGGLSSRLRFARDGRYLASSRPNEPMKLTEPFLAFGSGGSAAYRQAVGPSRGRLIPRLTTFSPDLARHRGERRSRDHRSSLVIGASGELAITDPRSSTGPANLALRRGERQSRDHRSSLINGACRPRPSTRRAAISRSQILTVLRGEGFTEYWLTATRGEQPSRRSLCYGTGEITLVRGGRRSLAGKREHMSCARPAIVLRANKPMKLAITLPRLRLGRVLAAYRQAVGRTSVNQALA